MIDVVVVGGGAMGSAAAWQLASRGAEVVLLERFAPGHAFGASHGAWVPAAAGSPGRVLTAAEATGRWPGFRFTGPVFSHPRSGRVHADRAVAALRAAAAHHGAEVRHEAPVVALRPRDGGVDVVTGNGVLRARRAVVAAGAWTRALLDGLVPLPPLTVTQEQPAHFAPPAGHEWPPFIHHGPEAVHGLATPGEGVKVGLHGGGPVVDPDRFG
ncbi:FAD-dependent oxidoreductase [Saccharothrix sp. Mg75]|uniref:FAD-dependent oxidoreductase n=1 Tax=Saccharothrix sp. Mg75 TaxID=3445357 RepID=UPI003EED548C